MKYYVDEDGVYLGGYDDAAQAPQDSTEVSNPPDDARQVWVGDTWTYTKAHLKALLAEYRYNKEVGGITLEGLPVPTDDRAKTLIAGKYSKVIAENSPETEFTIKVAGQFMTITYQDLIDIFHAVNAHVQKCFDCEAAVYALIEDETVTSKETVYGAFDEAFEA